MALPLTPVPPGTRRAQATLERRARIQAAALALFDAQGFEATTVTDVARQAGVSRATFFNHFPNKEAVLVAWFAEVLEGVQRDLAAELEEGDPFAALFRFFDALAGFTEAHRARVLPLMYELLNPDLERSRRAFLALPLAQLLRRLLARAQQRGQVRPDFSHGRLARVLANTYVLTALQWAAYRQDRSVRDELRSALTLALDGMRAAEP